MTTTALEGYERLALDADSNAASCERCGRRLVVVPVLSRHGASAGPPAWTWRCPVCPWEVAA